SQVLWELLEQQYHFFNARLVAEALERLGDPVPETEVERPNALRPLSIVALSGEAGIAVILDESFTGRSLCPSCRFFPCPINFRYRVGIEDCKLWNRTDPRTAGSIHDQRTKGRRFPRAGAKLPDIAVRAAAAERAMAVAEGLLADGPSREAIPLLCTVLIQAGDTSLLAPVAWVRLARCLEAHGEGRLARIAWCEALLLRGVLRSSYVTERADLDAFAVMEKARVPSLGAAFDRRSQTSGSTWFAMGQQHLASGELALAELCMRRAARVTGDSALKERFTKEADKVRRRADKEADPGLAVERPQGASGDES
ncbi:MAG TPA: hypothetical protein VFR03_06425, partial [Thermoanaerobaculia bacterium]|nr:hypothetical protein [Thermoanaerobaculia bacterium]